MRTGQYNYGVNATKVNNDVTNQGNIDVNLNDGIKSHNIDASTTIATNISNNQQQQLLLPRPSSSPMLIQSQSNHHLGGVGGTLFLSNVRSKSPIPLPLSRRHSDSQPVINSETGLKNQQDSLVPTLPNFGQLDSDINTLEESQNSNARVNNHNGNILLLESGLPVHQGYLTSGYQQPQSQSRLLDNEVPQPEWPGQESSSSKTNMMTRTGSKTSLVPQLPGHRPSRPPTTPRQSINHQVTNLPRPEVKNNNNSNTVTPLQYQGPGPSTPRSDYMPTTPRNIDGINQPQTMPRRPLSRPLSRERAIELLKNTRHEVGKAEYERTSANILNPNFNQNHNLNDFHLGTGPNLNSLPLPRSLSPAPNRLQNSGSLPDTPRGMSPIGTPRGTPRGTESVISQMARIASTKGKRMMPIG